MLPCVLRALPGRKGQPFPQGPNVVGQAGGHGGSPRHPSAVGISLTQCSHGPAEVVGVHREIGNRVMDVPILREAIGLANLPVVPVTVGSVLPFHERGVDLLADLRLFQGRHHSRHGSENDAKVDIHHPTAWSNRLARWQWISARYYEERRSVRVPLGWVF